MNRKSPEVTNKSFDALRSECTKGLVPATSPCNKSWGPVPSCELAIFASKSSRRDQLWSLPLVPRIQTSLNFWDTSPCDLFLYMLRVNCYTWSSLRPIPSCKLFMGLVPGTSPLLCADLYLSCTLVCWDPSSYTTMCPCFVLNDVSLQQLFFLLFCHSG